MGVGLVFGVGRVGEVVCWDGHGLGRAVEWVWKGGLFLERWIGVGEEEGG